MRPRSAKYLRSETEVLGPKDRFMWLGVEVMVDSVDGLWFCMLVESVLLALLA